jgi:hypothetical protein
MDVLAELDVVGLSVPMTRAGIDSVLLLEANPDSASLAERVCLHVSSKKVVRSRVQTSRLVSQMTNGQAASSNLQRATGLGLLSHYVLPGSNALLQTHRIAEV